MDSDRFDAVVRALAAHASRRETLQEAAALAAASVLALQGTGTAEAHHARIRLGGACRHTSQCLHHAPTSRRARPSRQSVYCADNGLRHDGSFNCCRTGGGSCTRNAHCCGRRHCRSGACTNLR
jgi:anaerobic glycerol-3-phosphate dehydrogenase